MPCMAYGVDPHRRAPYELRQSRYEALGADVAAEARRIRARDGAGRRVRLLDVGTFDGVARRYVEVHPGSDCIDYEAVDIYPYGREYVYKHADWRHHHIDLTGGLPGIASNAYDIVICEQVLEHLHSVERAIADLVRVVAPGGLLVVGVPIFTDGAHLLRRHLVPVLDRIFQPTRKRGHVQAWSLRTFRNEWKRHPELEIHETRGFRIISGGVLRPLEFTRAWWKLNRAIGAAVPGLCVEVQILGRKRAAAGAHPAAA